MPENNSLYFISLVPPEPIYCQAMEWKQYLAEHHKSKAALKSPPHITLHMPFKWKSHKEFKLLRFVDEVVIGLEAFEVSLNNFAAFPPRVIYIDIDENETLRNVQKKIAIKSRSTLNLFNDDYKNRGFTPHMTVAFRDLKKAEFLIAWEKLKSETFQGKFIVDHICLLKHNGKSWDILHRAYF